MQHWVLIPTPGNPKGLLQNHLPSRAPGKWWRWSSLTVATMAPREVSPGRIFSNKTVLHYTRRPSHRPPHPDPLSAKSEGAWPPESPLKWGLLGSLALYSFAVGSELAAHQAGSWNSLLDYHHRASTYSVHGILQATILEWVAIPFSRRSSWCRDQTGVSCIAGRVFTFWATKEAISLSFTFPFIALFS